MWPLAAADLLATDAAAAIATTVGLESKSLRDWSVGIAMLRNFDRREALKLATAAAACSTG